ncbi:LLM class flavin-dependent oxidoreductase [Amycolatopsis decaplanina]|uniref:Alkanesulfonate monooxygenase n=1 Tax=Amycolatopsis decaplanina DSM 44594 TaxID=1284240 RepID=M2ZWH5_9PSEU|nr:LLM class flavin-dependent oxidoreductase [Amycolatopsis decaplanina]EME64704.1 alkanesulfonate monooxygenase [Amycolatopsis decaplanina DSM 44594]
MSLQLHWFLPSHGDGREIAKTADGVAAPGARREPDLEYLTQVALAADRFGFTGMLTPFGLFCEDPWVVASALAGVTRSVKFMIALRPGFISPLLAAQTAATFQRVSDSRLLLNIVTGGDPDEQRRYGDWLDHDQRYARTGEFMDVFRQAWPGSRFDFSGEHYTLKAGMVARPHPVRPTLFLGGSSSAALDVAAAQADVLLMWGETPSAMASHLARSRERAEALGRSLRFGTRFHVISRDTSAEAWKVADQLLAGMDPARIRQAQERFAATESEGQRRMAALHAGRTDSLEIHPNVWAGYGLVRPGVGTALVGSHEEVAERIEEYHALGLDHLILSAQPHLEEAYTFGEGVMPLLRKRGLIAETL